MYKRLPVYNPLQRPGPSTASQSTKHLLRDRLVGSTLRPGRDQVGEAEAMATSANFADCSALYVWRGPRWAWALELTILSIVITFWTIFYRRLVPLTMPATTFVASRDSRTEIAQHHESIASIATHSIKRHRDADDDDDDDNKQNSSSVKRQNVA